MKRLKILIIVSILLTPAQAYSVTVNVPAAGQLSSVLTSTDMDSLTITGFLNSSDFSYMRSNLSLLTYLDISDVTVNNNAIPNSALSGKNLLKKVILPLSVTSIGSSAFYNCSALNDIVFPEGLQTINSDAFQNCTALTNIVFPEGLQTINSYAFYNCTALTNIVFPEGLQTINSYAFYNCTALTGELLLPSTITSLGYAAFYNCIGLASCRIQAMTPPSITDNSLGNIHTVFVPQGAGEDYKNASYWNQKLIIEGEPATITVNVTQAGALGAKILEQVESLYQVNKLIVAGTFNDTDWDQLKNYMPNLFSVDLRGISNTTLPNEQFYDKPGLLEIKLPNNLVTIGNHAFIYCRGLSHIEIPATVTTIGDYAFYECNPLQEIVLPAGLTTLGYYAFYGCRLLESIVIPSHIKRIESSTFAYCYRLKEINLPANLTEIGNNAFNNCTALQSIEFPNTITSIEYNAFHSCLSLSSFQLPNQLQTLGSSAFYHCPVEEIILPATLTNIESSALSSSTIKKITCLQPVPPVLNNSPFNDVNKTVCELVVPFWAETSYKLANIWNQFQIVTTYNTEIDYLPVSGTLTLSGNIRPLGTPTVEIMPQGNLNVLGTAPFNTNQFILRPQIRNYILTTSSSYKPYYSQLINEYDAITAQSAKIDMSIYGTRWYYLSFPFDIAMSDITIDEDAYYVFRYYDGESRATVGSGSSWKNVNTGDTLRAGTGYIFQCNKNVNHLVLPATGTSKNRLFASTTQAVALNAYPAENAANQNWNLAGNPFPSYYDIRCLDYTAPITYWNDYNSRYEAVSPVDDAFLLHPMQAFFVQKPADLNAITFTTEGRQTSPDIQTRSSLRSASDLSRTLINLTLSNENFSDKSRIVLNPDAQHAYEMERDAAKFMSIAPEAPQLYSIDPADVHYAINERPVGDGIVPLGFYTGNAGSYTLALKEQVEDYEILLKDKDLDKTTDLQTDNYPFNADAGTFDNRFELQIKKTGSNVTGYSAPENQNTIVYAAKGAIIVENGIGAITVYTINGAKLAVINASGAQNTIPALQGIYIVKVNGKVYKTIVF